MADLYCNYCGESVSFEYAYNHVVKFHEERIHLDPSTYHPKRRRRVLAVQISGSVIIMVSLAAIILLLKDVMTGGDALIMIVCYVSALMALFAGGEYFVRRGEKPAMDIVMDMFIECDICGARVPMRDRQMHDEMNHPEEQRVVKRVYEPVAIVMFALIGIGFGGLLLIIALGEADRLRDMWALIGIPVFSAFIAVGAILGALFEIKYHRPRLQKLRTEWSERHPRARLDDRRDGQK